MHREFQVFISHKVMQGDEQNILDSELATLVHDFLERKGIKVFLDSVSLEDGGISEYKRAIDEALDAAQVLIAVGTSGAHLNSQWVRYEWDSFFNDILSGIKPHGKVFVYCDAIELADLPRPLRQVQIFNHGKDGLERLYRFVARTLDHDPDKARDHNVPSGPPPANLPPAHAAPEDPPTAEIMAFPMQDVEIVTAPRDRSPFTIAAQVFEEDTSLVLSADSCVLDEEPEEHPIRLMSALYDMQLKTPGEIIVNSGDPRRILAIVYDFDEDPPCRTDWIKQAYENIFTTAEQLGWSALAVPPLGVEHGKYKPAGSIALLKAALTRNKYRCLRRIWLQLPPDLELDQLEI